jgi:hypothetical protein
MLGLSWVAAQLADSQEGLSSMSDDDDDDDDDWSKKTLENSRVEAGSNTSTVAQRVVGDDEKGSLESERAKYGRESRGTRTREWLRWRGPSEIVNDTHVLSSERASHINKPATVCP